MNLKKTLLAVLINALVNFGILAAWEKFFRPENDILQNANASLLREKPDFFWQIITALILAGLTALLFHSMAIPGSRATRGIYVGLTVGIATALLSATPWLTQFDVPRNLIWADFPKLLTLGIVGGLIYTFFYLSKRTAQKDENLLN